MSLQARFARFKQRPSSDLILYYALITGDFGENALAITQGATTYALTITVGAEEVLLTV